MSKKRFILLSVAVLFVFTFGGMAFAESEGLEDIIDSEVIGYDDMVQILQNFDEQSTDLEVFTLSEKEIEDATSEQGRELYVAKIGNGDKNIWVQGRIHGNEPYGTNSTLKMINNLINEKDESYELMMEELTMHFIPMYNPDGAEANARTTTLYDQETGEPILDENGRTIRIDLNRDWGEDEFAARESLAFYKYWADVKPDFMFDLHHQGQPRFHGTDIPATYSLGISLAPGGPTLPYIKDGKYEDLTRQSMAYVYDAIEQYPEFAGNRYTVGAGELNIFEGLTSATQLGVNYQNINPEEHSHPSAFFEASGQFLDGEREPMIYQMNVATHAFLFGLASGEIYDTDPNGWDEIPIRPTSHYLMTSGNVPIDPPKPGVPLDVSVADLKVLTDRYEEINRFGSQEAARSLQLHSMAMTQFENTGQTEKVVNHMDGFMALLDHQRDNEFISEETYHVLKAYADYLITIYEENDAA